MLHSEVGKGTTVEVYLPTAAEAGDIALSKPIPTEQKEQSKVIFLVEDAPGLRDIMRETRESGGYTVLAAESDAEAVHLAKQHLGPIDLLLTDATMPRMNGPVLARAITTTHQSAVHLGLHQ